MEIAIALIAGATMVGGFLGAWRKMRRTDAYVSAIRELREIATAVDVYRIPTAADADLVELLDGARGAVNELLACGFTTLGSLVFVPPGAFRAAIRVLVDEPRTTCAIVMVAARSPDIVRCFLESFTADEVHITRSGEQPGLAVPPFEHRRTATGSLDAAYRTHVAATPASCAALADLDAVVAALLRMRARTVAWRDAQSPDALLELDLRGVLGKHYDEYGPHWARRLAAKLPEARVRVS